MKKISSEKKIDKKHTLFTKEEKIVIKEEVDILKKKYSDYIPILVLPKNDDIKLTKKKFLVNGDITIGQFLLIVRKKITNINSTESLYFIIDNTLPPISSSLIELYNEKKDIDTNMLYITLCKENTFGIKNKLN